MKGVAEEFRDEDEIGALFKEQGGGRVAEVVEADAAEAGSRRSVVKVRVRWCSGDWWQSGPAAGQCSGVSARRERSRQPIGEQWEVGC
ncbi:hypothetical protein GCM10010245_07010 [Streptomyces spectabilis]|nr:hypothetical protein GCM10010245_07010 [Streptomyces spectabilis]